MIFDKTMLFESEKERNLYYKFFAGFFLNELVDGYQSRTQALRLLLNRRLLESGSTFKLENFDGTLLASFDYHSYLLENSSDKGELADILIEDLANRSVIAIEAKFLTDWNFDKDITANAERIKILRDKFQINVIQALLLTRRKHTAVMQAANHPDSNYHRLLGYSRESKQPFIVLEWEELIGLVDKSKYAAVADYFTDLVGRNREDFRR
ncbi:MAG: hypothetical protein JXA15_13025 [Spirochaetales bacterium]|nr:hypothetical protein [Spirochaetales bacterium]